MNMTKKPTQASVTALIAREDYHRWPGTDMISCALILKNGHVVTGESCPMDTAEFDELRGKVEARRNAINEIWPLAVSEYRTMLTDLSISA
ncbi:Gp49 family protein [Pseudomonas extremaustralis]